MGEDSAKLRWLGLVISVGMYPFCFLNGVRRRKVSGGEEKRKWRMEVGWGGGVRIGVKIKRCI